MEPQQRYRCQAGARNVVRRQARSFVDKAMHEYDLGIQVSCQSAWSLQHLHARLKPSVVAGYSEAPARAAAVIAVSSTEFEC